MSLNIDPTKRPANTEPDGRVYSLEHSYPMEVTGVDHEGALVWEPAANVTAIPDYEPMMGTYAEVSEKATALNALQIRLYGMLQHIFSPSPVEPLAA